MGSPLKHPEGTSHFRYLGDGVYAHFDGFQVWLTANHHDPREATDKIALEAETLDAFLRYLTALKESLERHEHPDQI